MSASASSSGDEAETRDRRRVRRKWPALLALALVLIARTTLGLMEPRPATLVSLPVVIAAWALWAFSIAALNRRNGSWLEDVQRTRRGWQSRSRTEMSVIKRAIRRRDNVPSMLGRPAAAYAHHRVLIADFEFWTLIAIGALMQAQLFADAFPWIAYGGLVTLLLAMLLAYAAFRRRADREALRSTRRGEQPPTDNSSSAVSGST